MFGRLPIRRNIKHLAENECGCNPLIAGNRLARVNCAELQAVRVAVFHIAASQVGNVGQ
jgi:hypothetical protein